MWPFMREIIRRGDTFCYDPNQTEDEAQSNWVYPDPARVVVAIDDGDVVGTSNMYPNHEGPGSHIASGNFMVSSSARRSGVGFILGVDMLRWAKASGYDGIQFNAVAESNLPAKQLYKKLGFEIIGTVPGAFMHPEEGPVGLHFMFHDLAAIPSS
jgi:GNAT superfamily N-acetyltransferase